MAKGGRRNHSGRLAKPTEMKLVEGTFRQDRHGNGVQVAAKWPEPPAHLSERQRAMWNSLEAGCKTWVAETDWPALNGAVAIMDRILTIQEKMAATPDASHPLTFKYTTDGDGNAQVEAKENPLYTLEMKLWTALRGYIAILGLSPADRARMKAPEKEKDTNPLDRFIKGARG